MFGRPPHRASRRAHRGKTRTCGLTVLVLSWSLGFTQGSPALAQTKQDDLEVLIGRMTLVNQTPWITPNSDVDFSLSLVGLPISKLETLVMTVYRALPTRSDFNVAVDSSKLGRRIYSHAFYPKDLDIVGDKVNVNLDGTTDDQTNPNQVKVADLGLTEFGVYPVEFEANNSQGALARLTSYLIYLPSDVEALGAKRLDLGLIWPVELLPLDDVSAIDEVELESLESQATALAELPESVPLAVSVSPESLTRIESSGLPAARSTLQLLTVIAANHPVLAAPFAPVDFGALAEANLPGEAGRQLDRGQNAVVDLLGAQPNNNVLYLPLGIDDRGMALLSGALGAMPTRLIVPSTAIANFAPTLTPSRPIEPSLAGSGSTKVMIADEALTSRLEGQDGNFTSIIRFLADLAMLWQDQPSVQRAQSVVLPTNWTFSKQDVANLVRLLGDSPMSRLVPIESAFDLEAQTEATASLISLVTPSGTQNLAAVLSARQTVDSLATALAKDSEKMRSLKDALLAAESIRLDQPLQRVRRLDTINSEVNQLSRSIELPRPRSLRLNGESVELPLTINNASDENILIAISVRDSNDQELSKPAVVELAPRSSTVRIPVKAPRRGSFTAIATASTPDGRIDFGAARIAVLSSGGTGWGIVAYLVIAGLLLIWLLVSLIGTTRVSGNSTNHGSSGLRPSQVRPSSSPNHPHSDKEFVEDPVEVLLPDLEPPQDPYE